MWFISLNVMNANTFMLVEHKKNTMYNHISNLQEVLKANKELSKHFKITISVVNFDKINTLHFDLSRKYIDGHWKVLISFKILKGLLMHSTK